MKRCFLFSVILLVGCATSASGPVPADEFTGYFSWGFETARFQPCGSEEAWWVTGGDELRQRYQEVAAEPYEPVYVVIRGDTTPEGRYGHLGVYTREMHITEVLDVRPDPSEICP